MESPIFDNCYLIKFHQINCIWPDPSSPDGMREVKWETLQDKEHWIIWYVLHTSKILVPRCTIWNTSWTSSVLGHWIWRPYRVHLMFSKFCFLDTSFTNCVKCLSKKQKHCVALQSPDNTSMVTSLCKVTTELTRSWTIRCTVSHTHEQMLTHSGPAAGVAHQIT